MEETIPRQVNVSFHASEQYAPKAVMSLIMLGFTPYLAEPGISTHNKRRSRLFAGVLS
jgi:hypothetical protein